LKDDLSDFSPKRNRGPRFLLSLPGLTWEFLLVVLVFGVPKAFTTYVDFAADLSGPTIWVIRTSRWVIRHAPTLLVLLGAVWVVQVSLSAWAGTRAHRVGSALNLVGSVVLLILVLVALALPIPGILARVRG
jgi:type II secretory pathway component PulF